MNIHPLHSNNERPARFTYPFCYEPHPLCCQAAAEVQQYIATHEEIRCDADNGKMFGVLVVESAEGLAFLADTSKSRSARFLSPLTSPLSPLNRCPKSCRHGCSTSTNCSTPVVRSKTSLTSGNNTTADLNSGRNTRCHQEVRVTAVRQSCCNMPTSTLFAPSAWPNSGGERPPRRSCAST